MREPNYKVLVKSRNKIETVQSIELNVFGRLKKVNTGFTTYVIAEDRDQFILSEATGLFDKNNTPIYENHIVKRNGKRYFIKYETGSFMLVRMSEKTNMYMEFTKCWSDEAYPLSQLYWSNDDQENRISDIEIIGFEPDLKMTP